MLRVNQVILFIFSLGIAPIQSISFAQEIPQTRDPDITVVVRAEDVHSRDGLLKKLSQNQTQKAKCNIKSESSENPGQYTIDILAGFPPVLNIDDTHPPEPCDLEINTFVRGDHARGFHELGQHNDFNYGTGFLWFHHVQLKAEFEESRGYDQQQSGTESGLSDVLFGMKWMFFSNEENENVRGAFKNMALAFYPQVTVKPGVGEKGQIYSFPFLVTKRFNVGKRPAGFTGNVAYEHGVHGQPDDAYWSVGAGIAITPLTTGVASISDEHFFDSGNHRLVQVQVGIRNSLRENIKVFAMVGRVPNVKGNRDGRSHWIWDTGIQFVIHKRKNRKNSDP